MNALVRLLLGLGVLTLLIGLVVMWQRGEWTTPIPTATTPVGSTGFRPGKTIGESALSHGRIPSDAVTERDTARPTPRPEESSNRP